MFIYWPYLVADYYLWLEYAIAFVAVLILLSCADDIFIDIWYWVRRTNRFLTKDKIYKPLSVKALTDKPEQHIAIMVPAWLEYDVIDVMLENMVGALDYRAYTIFVGTYQNDPETIAVVERMRRRYKQLIRVEVPHDGPTCKADCLNWITQAIFAFEEERGIQFSGTIVHDSEDVLHPLELKFFNYLLPRKDLIQLPVFSLERDWFELIASVYMDEFAEWHRKDLVVRESITGMVPSAGTGTCFSRRALLALSEDSENQPFNTQTLTEDYDIGVRLARYGMSTIIAHFPVEYSVRRARWFGFGKPKDETVKLPLSVREYFPNTLKASYRQKTRWALGICFQGWSQFGWSGSLSGRYFLMRDRKGMVTTFVAIIAYILVLQYFVLKILFVFGGLTISYPPPGNWVAVLLILNALALGWRVTQRFYFTASLYGWEHGLLAIPRMVIVNVVSFLAMSRAWRLYLRYIFTGKKLVWDKTMHDFPTHDGLIKRRLRLGELLVSWQVINPHDIETALEEQKNTKTPIGRHLLEVGKISEDVLAEAIAFQNDLALALDFRSNFSTTQNHLPTDLSLKWHVLALKMYDQEELCLIVASPLEDTAQEQIRSALGYFPKQLIARESDIEEELRALTPPQTNNMSVGLI